MQIPVTNNTATMMYVGGALIPPGETRHFEEYEVPEHLRPAVDVPAEEAQSADPLAEVLAALLDGNVASVVATLPEMPTADIERLGEMEQAGAARKGILSAIAEVLLDRSADPTIFPEPLPEGTAS